MIQTLKSELKLRPTYDELVGMIESQGDPNRPSIEQVIDRKATIFRNNQFGSQFDNIDFLGLKKQEEDRAKENLRQAQLKNAGIQQGTSTGLMGIDTSGYVTPVEVYEDAMLRPEPTPQELEQIRGQLMAYDDLMRMAMEQVRTRTQSDLSDVHSQSLPAGVPVHSIATDEEDDLPPLEPITTQSNQGYPPSLPPPPQQPITEEADDTEQIMKIFDDMKIQQSVKAGIKYDLNKMNLNDWSTIDPSIMKRDTLMTIIKIADKMGKLSDKQKEQFNIVEEKIKSTSSDTPEYKQAMEEAKELFRNAFHNENDESDEELTALEQKVVFTSGFDSDKVMEDDSINYKGLMFQLHVRDLLNPGIIEMLNKTPTDQKKKKVLVTLIEALKENDEWYADFNSEKLSRKIKEFKKIRRRVKSKVVEPSASSSGGDAVVPSQPSSSSTPLRDIAVAGAKAGVETLAKAGATALAKSFLPA